MFAWLRAASSSSSAAAAAAAADAAAQLQTTAADVSHTFRHGPMGLKLYTPPVFDCYPPSHAALSLLCVADSHGHFPDAACTPPCDVLLVPGDFTLTGSEAEVLFIRTRATVRNLTRCRRCCSFTRGRRRASGATACSCPAAASCARA